MTISSDTACLHAAAYRDLLKWVINEWENERQNELPFYWWKSWGPSIEEPLDQVIQWGRLGSWRARPEGGMGFPDAPYPQPPNHVPLEPGAPESARLIPGLTVWCFLPARDSPYTLPRAFQSLPLGSSSQKTRRQLLIPSTPALIPSSTSPPQWHSHESSHLFSFSVLQIILALS